MKKVIIAVIVIAIAAGAYIFFSHKKKSEIAANKYLETEVVLADMAEYVEATGSVDPENRIDVTPASSGRIEKLLVEEGDRVKKGQVLAEMSSSDRVAILDAARSMSEADYKHYQESYKPIKITAPQNGTIILKDAVNGQTVSSSDVIYAISDTLIIEASVDESDIGKVKVGQTALINLDAYPETTVEGKIFRIADEGVTTNNVIQYTVKIRMTKIPSFFKSQMTANIKIRLTDARQFLLIPAYTVAISPKTGNTAVITGFDSDKAPIYTDIETGSTTDSGVEVVSGLKEGQAVYYKNATYKVQKTEEESTNPFMPKGPGSKKSTSTAKSGAKAGR